MAERARVAAILGPTNTGKTHYAIDRMLGYRSGIIGLPLRLLAREVYDKIVRARGPSVVALVTGEERIVPPRAAYWVCTVEAMPEGMGCDFAAIDEIQLCADPERGHVFTDRLLRMRGTKETLFLGSDTMRGPIAALVPGVEFMRRERMSELSYTGPKKISRMKPRSAIVGFSVENVYAIAELIRRQKGGAAVVMGALSPRTRNAQVELYQNGEVDYLVATDAIGMGLNLDIDHVAFSSLTKFDGRRMRPLAPNELAQIAGRAGRGMANGTFGVTGEAPPLEEEVAEAIVEHRFTPIRKLNWRSAQLAMGSIERLIASLEAQPDHQMLVKAREADDLAALRALSDEAEVLARASDPASVALLWDVCRIPDFRGISRAEHAGLLKVIFGYLHERGTVPDDFLARQVHRIDRADGDIDTLSKRLAYIRTWTYVAQRKAWVADEEHWRGRTRAVEDSLSDALHARLTQRFVDRRTSVLLRRLKQKEALLAEVNDKGEVTVEGEFVGRLEGFRFRQDKDASAQEAKTLRAAAVQALTPQFHLRADRFYNAPDTEIDFTDQGGLMWGEQAVGKLAQGDEPLRPRIVTFVDDEAGPDVAQKVERRLQHFLDRKIAALFEPLLTIQKDETLTGLAKGFGFRMVESMGVLPRAQVAEEVRALDQDARGALRKHGIRFGQFTIFMPALLKPAPTRLRLMLWSLARGLDTFPEAPPPGLVTVPEMPGTPNEQYAVMGYRKAGVRAIRIDMLERLADIVRGADTRGGFEATADMLSITGLTLEQFADLMQGLGYRAERAEREKVRAVDQTIPTDEGAAHQAEVPSADTPEAEAETSAEAAEGDVPVGETAEVVGAEPDASDTPVFDAAQDVEPGAVTEQPEITPATEAEAAVEAIPDADLAPVAEEPAEEQPESPIPEVSDEEVPVGTPPDVDVAAPETEVYYVFTWAGGRGNRQGDGARGGPRGNREGQRAKGGGKPKGGKKPPREGRDASKGPRNAQSKPPVRKDRIDPDNPFAAALAGFKGKS